MLKKIRDVAVLIFFGPSFLTLQDVHDAFTCLHFLFTFGQPGAMLEKLLKLNGKVHHTQL